MDLNEEKKKDARLIYETTINLMIKEENLFWSQFNAFLITNSIFIGGMFLLIDSFKKDNTLDENIVYLMTFVCFIGLILCFLWIFLTFRRDAYRKFYLFMASEKEKTHFYPFDVLSSRGKQFSIEGKAEISGINYHQKWLDKLKVPNWAIMIITLFILIYLIMISYLINCRVFLCFIQIFEFCPLLVFFLIIIILFFIYNLYESYDKARKCNKNSKK